MLSVTESLLLFIWSLEQFTLAVGILIDRNLINLAARLTYDNRTICFSNPDITVGMTNLGPP